MATTTNKQKLLTQLFTEHKRPESPLGLPRPVLEQFLYGICREGTTRERADRAFQRLRDHFYDWNEIRVSSPHEVEEALIGLPNAVARAERLINFLQEVFETTFSFDLESLQKKGLKQAAKQLSRFQAANDYIVAWVVQKSLGGHAIPIDEPTLHAVRRLGLVDEEQGGLDAVRATLEHLVPKARGAYFCDMISDLAEEMSGEEATAVPSNGARTSRNKPR